ncbi:response regulator transcription factor [Lacrimispora sp. 210928-DFI.3.58]|uniref:response regulator transcription factor n=1 Tax=Lacrimispora sp. 210928-DFI.3.58 TaxID=2883214 RepID=UPI0015B6FA77|nr:response regulator [Lacrimispora sp. 210928-DFI.3.58]MCB7318495.1 response regulator [Lacrimispora sp. 210928-DFI.3.58]
MYKVIVIEDETMVRRGIILTINWQALDCVIVGEAANGEEGAELVKRLSPDIIVTDVKMPRMDGVEMIAKLREQGCRARFIILTAYSDFKYAQSALRLGVSDYLLKPLKDGDLEQAIEHIKNKLEERPAGNRENEAAAPVLRFHSEKKAKNKYVEEAIQYIQAHYHEDITISTVAGSLEISEGYLSRVFKKETDYTFTSYLTYYRMQQAMNLLKDCRVKVYEVADKVGYSDTAYFSAQFKKIVGISPSEYQDRCR